jgi:hypothetical protein
VDVPEREAFRSWLCQHAGEWVGEAGSVYSCPLAVHLSERIGKRCGVGPMACWTEDREEYSRLPLWAKEFVLAVDQGGGTYSGQRALACLERIEQVFGGLLEEF